MLPVTYSPADHDNLVAFVSIYQLLVENSIDVMIRYNASRARIYVSPSCYEIFGYSPAEMLTSDRSAVIHPEDFLHIDPKFKECGPTTPKLQLTFRMRRKDGFYVWIEGQYRYLPDDKGLIAVLRDISARKEAEGALAKANQQLESLNEALRKLAQQDGLTGLANRRRFNEVFEEEFRRARRQKLPLGVLLIDVDHFKAYNDYYGHLAGDECLRQIGAVLQRMLRRPGDHAARYGGEEFVILLPATDHQATKQMAEQIRAAVAAMGISHSKSERGVVTLSVGTSTLIPNSDADLPTQLIAAADRALYQSKAEGRDRVSTVMTGNTQ